MAVIRTIWQFDLAGITISKNTIPYDPRSPFVTSGLRLGTPAMTTAGMGTDADGDGRVPAGSGCAGHDDDGELASVRWEVTTLCSKFTPYPTGGPCVG